MTSESEQNSAIVGAMTDAPPPGQPQPPQQPAQPSFPPAGGATPPPYTGAPSYAPGPGAGAGYGGAPVKKQTLSIVSLVLGIVGFIFGWLVIFPFIGSILQLFVPAGAIIVGFIAKSREPQAPRALWLVGIILGAVALLTAIIAAIGWGVFVATCGNAGACTS
jgi:hypothetical protein